MEKCIICGDDQDCKQFEGYNICTTCADVMEDVMGEYFFKMICDIKKPRAHENFLKYVNNTSRYVTDYKKVISGSGKYTKEISERVAGEALESDIPSKSRYFERVSLVLEWLKKNPQFFHYYFKEYYVCPGCGASIFERFSSEEVGEWVVVTCSNCGTMIKKYFSPKKV
jgi:hypothetical protein